MKNKIPAELANLYSLFDSCERCRNANNPLRHVLGGGRFSKPDFLFLFMNPTHLNLSSHPDYAGKRRYPFIGVRHFYRLLSEAGFLDRKVVEAIYSNGWQIEDEDRVEQSLAENSVYITNLVKCTQNNPENPTKEAISESLPLLKREIIIVIPRFIVAFGRLAFRAVTNSDIRLSDCLGAVSSCLYHPLDSIEILGRMYPVLPCYFPAGRGNPKKALEIMSFIKRKYQVGQLKRQEQRSGFQKLYKRALV